MRVEKMHEENNRKMSSFSTEVNKNVWGGDKWHVTCDYHHGIASLSIAISIHHFFYLFRFQCQLVQVLQLFI